MPELPEVETIARGLKKKILGREIIQVQLLGSLVVRSDPKRFVRDLEGQTMESIRRHGKFLFIGLNPSLLVLKVHLGMTGQLVFEPTVKPLLKHTHILFRFSGLQEDLRYRDIRRFGFLEILKEADTRLGPDAWESSDDDVFSSLRQKSGMLKHALLNQAVVAGLGNIYVDESLYRSKLHPRKTLESLSGPKLRELCVSIRSVLKDSLDAGGTSFRNYVDTTGGRGGFRDRLKVYGKTGKMCFCGGVIKRILVAGRSTHICPRCQLEPKTFSKTKR